MSSARPLDLRRRWLAIIAGTVVLQFCYWPLVASVAQASAETSELSTGLLAFGFAIVPFAFMVLAFASRQDDAPVAVLKAMGLFVLLGLPIIVLLDGVTGMVAGLGAGGVVTLRRDVPHTTRWRWVALAVAVVYVLVLRAFTTEFALMSGAVLPFAIHGLVDQAAEVR